MFKTKSKILRETQRRVHGRTLRFFYASALSMSGVITANAASTLDRKLCIPVCRYGNRKSGDACWATPYTFGNKGYWYAYDQGQYTPLSVANDK